MHFPTGASLQLKASLQENNRTIDADVTAFNGSNFNHNNTEQSFFETESVLTALSILPISML